MRRFSVREDGRDALPAIDVDADVIVIGSGEHAHVRLPPGVAEPEHVRIERGAWHAVGPVTLDGESRTTGEVRDGVTLSIGRYRIEIGSAPAGATSTSPQRTASLARELVRSLLGGGAAPSLEVERGPLAGARRTLAPPESTLVIGRGDEAGWIIADEDLSRAHAEIRRTWDGIRVADRGSKNGTTVDGAPVGPEGRLLRDGALVALGSLVLRFRDPAEKHLGGTPRTTTTAATASSTTTALPPVSPRARSVAPFYAALAVLCVAVAGLVWMMSW